MDQVNTLRQYGLFDAKVPRYTSYPPANRFEPGVGSRFQKQWLGQVPASQPISLYVHIPFCRRLCWFCACRTQGTKTLGPVESYLDVVLKEIDTVAEESLPKGTGMKRLHLGGGTPTLLNAELMTRLLDRIHDRFARTDGFEFSVEIDPTEVAPGLLKTLAGFEMNRASVGVQDFEPKVQQAIGRIQGFEMTQEVIAEVRRNGVRSLNIDLLYGLPFQTAESLLRTLDRVILLQPDRVALYGYAHVPHVSKRQMMIPYDALPEPEKRFNMSEVAKERLVSLGYEAIGIDHFALPHDSLSKAAKDGSMSRNFQGYTDDPCQTLIGFGASAISKFPQGYVQNAVSTSAYMQRIQAEGLAAHTGIALTSDDRFIAALVNGIMCNHKVGFDALSKLFPKRMDEISRIVDNLTRVFPDLWVRNGDALTIRPEFVACARLVAAHLDRTRHETGRHSLAI